MESSELGWTGTRCYPLAAADCLPDTWAGTLRQPDSDEKWAANPLVDPSIALADTFDSFTPTTLEEMVAQQKTPAMRHRLRLFDLPREIRDRIYSLLLRPAGGVPMDFSPCTDCEHEHGVVDQRTPRCLSHLNGSIDWYQREWFEMRSYLEPLSIVCRQMQDEIQENFWSQPFRFTSSLGWSLLDDFLLVITPANIARLKNITMCHPGFSLVEQHYASRRLRNHHHTDDIDDAYDELVLDHTVWLFGLDWSGKSSTGRRGGMFFGDPEKNLIKYGMSLTKFTLVLPQFQPPALQPTFKDLISHPIHRIDWPQGNQLSRHIVYLMFFDDLGHHAGSRDQISFAQIYGTDNNLEKQEETTEAQHEGDDVLITQTSYHEPGRAELARNYFDEVQGLGWKVTEVMHDRRCQYPVEQGEACGNVNLCKYLRTGDGASYKRRRCLGNEEERLAHTGERHPNDV